MTDGKREWIDCIRDGKITRHSCRFGFVGEFFLVPVRDEPRAVGAGRLFMAPPAEVLRDHFSQENEKYFAKKEQRTDWYRLCGRTREAWLFEYDRTEVRTVVDYDRVVDPGIGSVEP